MSSSKTLRRLVRAALIAAVYVALCLLLAPIAFGPVQLRVAEALCLLAVLCPEAVAGVTVGCFIANLLASAPVDMLVGTLATLVATLWARRLRRVRFRGLALAASLPPVLVNALAVGAELTILYNGVSSPPAVWLANMLSVAAGQLASCTLLGVALVWALERNPAALRVVAGQNSRI